MKIEYTVLILLIIQIIIASWTFTLDPIIQQDRSTILISLNFVITSILLYIYRYREKIYPKNILELDEEWIVVGLAVIIFILLTILFI